MGSGAVSAVMAGQIEMLQWFAGNWDSGKSILEHLRDRNSSWGDSIISLKICWCITFTCLLLTADYPFSA